MDPLSAATATIAATVLSSSSGLRAYLPLFGLGIAARVGVVQLQPGFDILKNPLMLVALGALALLEIVADKIPVVDHVSDVIHTVIRPIMGALIFSGSQNLVSMTSTPLAAGLGLVLAGGVHGMKALSRPVVTATTVGIGNPVVSILEDIVTIVLTVLAIALPIVALILLILFIALFLLIIRWLWRRLRRRKRQQQAKVAGRGSGAGTG